MEFIVLFLFVAASALIYANLRNALAYCEVLLDGGACRRGDIRWRRNRIFRNALLVAAVIMYLALHTSPHNGAAVTAPDRLFFYLLTVGLVFSQRYEQWAFRQCERLAAGEYLHHGRRAR
jgi:hypothetical protein